MAFNHFNPSKETVAQSHLPHHPHPVSSGMNGYIHVLFFLKKLPSSREKSSRRLVTCVSTVAPSLDKIMVTQLSIFLLKNLALVRCKKNNKNASPTFEESWTVHPGAGEDSQLIFQDVHELWNINHEMSILVAGRIHNSHFRMHVNCESWNVNPGGGGGGRIHNLHFTVNTYSTPVRCMQSHYVCVKHRIATNYYKKMYKRISFINDTLNSSPV